MKTLTGRQIKDIRIISRFTQVWCVGHDHIGRQPLQLPGGLKPVLLCQSCSTFLEYAVARRVHCPIEAENQAANIAGSIATPPQNGSLSNGSWPGPAEKCC